MSITEAITVLNQQQEQHTQAQGSKTYEEFIEILRSLEKKQLTINQTDAIELKLDTLDISTDNKKQLKATLEGFLGFLKQEFSLVSQGYHTGLGLIYGAMFGAVIGLLSGMAYGGSTGTAYGLSIGAAAGLISGLVYGSSKDAEARKQNRILA